MMREILETSRRGLDIKMVSYKYVMMRQKEETSLVVVVIEVEVGTRELVFDDLPGHRLTVSHINIGNAVLIEEIEDVV